MNRMRTKLAAVLVAGLVLAAGACGGGGSKEETSSGEALKSSAESTTTTESSSSDGSSGDIEDLNDAMDALGGDCMQAGLAYFALSMQALGASFGMSESDLSEMQSSIDELKADIPSAIESDFAVYADALTEYANAMRGMDMGDLMSGSSQAEEAAKILESPEVTEAQANIDAYFDKECPS